MTCIWYVANMRIIVCICSLRNGMFHNNIYRTENKELYHVEYIIKKTFTSLQNPRRQREITIVCLMNSKGYLSQRVLWNGKYLTSYYSKG